MESTLEFLLIFAEALAVGLYLVAPVLFCLNLLIFGLGAVVGKKEGWPLFDALYWSFITGTTVGYGDLTPKQRGSKLLAVLIVLMGLILSGILVAIGVRATTLAFESTAEPRWQEEAGWADDR
ncbi:MAG: potassium channel family protein [Acidobacteriota bacterium]